MKRAKLKILLVEDDPAHLEALARAIGVGLPNAVVRTAGSLREFRKIKTADPPDIAIMDLNLPDGRAIDALILPPEAGLFPFVVMTSYGNEEVAVEAMKAGALEYMVKTPETITNAPHTIERVLREWDLRVARKRSEANYRIVAYNTYDWEFWTDPDGRFLYCSPSCSRITGHESREFLADPNLLKNIVHPDDHDALNRHQREAVQRKVCEAEFRIIRPDGDCRWVHHACQPVFDSDGMHLGARGCNRDVTEQKHAEEALRRSKERFRLAVECSNDFVYERDTQTGVAFFGDSFDACLGYPPGGFPRSLTGWMEHVHPGDLARVMETIRTQFQNNKPYALEYRMRRSDGTYADWWDRGIILRDTAGQPTRNIGAAADITERKRAENALSESKERLDLALHSARMGAWYWDLVEDKRYFDEQTCRVVGIDPTAFTGTAEEFFRVVHPDDREALRTVYTRCIEQGTPYDFEFRTLWPDEDIRYFSGTGRLTRDEAGRPLRLNGLVWDSTERKKKELLQELTIDTLTILNYMGALPETTAHLVHAIKERTGLDAIGIRLGNSAEDFTYFVQEGFSEEFLVEENSLLSYAPDGTLRRDENGRPLLECTCGLVLSGRTDPDNPLFTKRGSFWCNDTTALLSLTPEQDPRPYPRNHCIHMGYGSVALIPIRVGAGIAGLLQLNDRRPNRFTLKLVRFFEGIAASIGVALVRQKNIEDLLESEADLAAAQRIAHIGSWRRDIAADTASWTDEAYRIFGRVPGALEDHRRAFLEMIHPEDRSRVNQALTATLEGTSEYNLEYRIVLPDKTTKVIHARGEVVRGDDGRPITMRGTAHDITERKRAEQRLRDSEERFRLAVYCANDFVYERDMQTGLADFPDSFDACLGYPPGGFPRTIAGWMEHIHPDDLVRVIETIQTQFQKDEPYVVEYRKRRRDGTYAEWSDRGILLRDDAGNPLRNIGAATDITARRRVETELRRTNRALVMISECNQALVRASSEVELLQELCRLIVKYGGYKLAWVGYAENDDRKTVRPIAWAGHDAEYVRQVNVTWADVERGRGPTGTAIRERRPVFTQNMESDDSFLPWRAAARERGYGSAISLPLIWDGRAFGSLSIYAPVVDAFHADEVTLLSELAGDMAYGIMALRARIERKKADASLLLYRDQLRLLAAELSSTEERERHRLAAYLHDDIGQALALAKIKLGAIQSSELSDAARAATQEARQLLTQAIAGTRSVMVDLSPPALYQLGLTEALESLAEDIQQQHGLEVLFEENGEPQELETDVRVVLYRGARELLINVVKHAKAGRARLALEWHAERLYVTVEDDGVGFNGTEVRARVSERKTFGLFNVQERLHYIGGEAVVESTPGQGARITLKAPFVCPRSL